MTQLPCPNCMQAAEADARKCPHCKAPLLVPSPMHPVGRLRIVPVDCTRCHGTGHFRNRSWLPWNNMAALVLLAGTAAVISATCVAALGREFFIGGLVASMIGLGLYFTGDECKRCDGIGKLYRVVPPRQRQPQKYVEVRPGPTNTKNRSNPVQRPTTRRDTSRRR